MYLFTKIAQMLLYTSFILLSPVFSKLYNSYNTMYLFVSTDGSSQCKLCKYENG